MAFWWVQGCSSSQLEGDLAEYPQKALHSKEQGFGAHEAPASGGFMGPKK